MKLFCFDNHHEREWLNTDDSNKCHVTVFVTSNSDNGNESRLSTACDATRQFVLWSEGLRHDLV